jgi:hypothetical protein
MDEETLASDDDDEMVCFGTGEKQRVITPACKKPKSVTFRPSCARTTSATKGKATTVFPMATASKATAVNKSMFDSVDLNDVNLTPVEGSTDSGTPYNFTPMYWQWMFEDKDSKQHLCIVLNLPSGMCRGGKLSGEVVPSVMPDGLSISVRYVWPEFFTDLVFLRLGLEREKMAPATMFSLEMTAKKELKELRKGMSRMKHQPLMSTTSIPLKYEVETSIKKFVPLFDGESAGMCLVIILKVRETDTGELENKAYDFRWIDKKRKSQHTDNDALW